MKRFALVLVALLVMGCASQQQPKVKYISSAENPQMWRDWRKINDQAMVCVDNTLMYKFKMAIVDSDDMNAIVFPKDRYVIVYRGLYDRCTYEELLFVMAHEFSHVKLKHYEKGVATSLGTSAAMNIANIFLPGVGYLNHVVNPLVVRGFSRSQEKDADVLACQSINNFYDIPPAACISALEKLRDYAALRGITDDKRIGIWDTHPAVADRIDTLKEKLAAQGNTTPGDAAEEKSP